MKKKILVKNFCEFIKQNHFNPAFSDTKNYLKKMKSYLEVLSVKGVEKDLNLLDLKKFYGIINITKDFIESNLVESIEIKEKIRDIVSLNNKVEDNLNLSKYLYEDIQIEKNDFIFRLLLANSFSLIKKKDEDSSFLEYLPYFSYNLKTINPKLILKSDMLLETIKELTKDINFQENYKAASTVQFVNFLNIFPGLGVKITDEEFFKFHENKIHEEYFNNLKELSYPQAFDFFLFFINFKDTTLDFRKRLKIKNNFKDYFVDKMIEIIKANDNSENLETKILIRYDDILNILIQMMASEKKENSNFLKICEYVLNLKLNNYICPIKTLAEIAHFYSENNIINKSIIHFIAFNCMEHLKIKVNISTFERYILNLYGLICENYNLIENSETVEEYFEEFKSCIFYNRFLDIYKDEFNSINISQNCLQTILFYHNKLLNSNYYDKAFENYLKKAIVLNETLTTIF